MASQCGISEESGVGGIGLNIIQNGFLQLEKTKALIDCIGNDEWIMNVKLAHSIVSLQFDRKILLIILDNAVENNVMVFNDFLIKYNAKTVVDTFLGKIVREILYGYQVKYFK